MAHEKMNWDRSTLAVQALHLIDEATGAVVHEMELPGVPYGAPITYMNNGKQFISLTIVAGTQAKLIGLSL